MYGSQDIDALYNPWFCFAARGLSYSGRVSILFIWKDTRSRYRRDWIRVDEVWQPSEDWVYSCINMPEIARNRNISWIASQMHERSYIKVQDILLNTHAAKRGNWYMDEITISPQVGWWWKSGLVWLLLILIDVFLHQES